jgi:hypothetical protein
MAEVPNARAVGPMNWMRPMAPLPAALRIVGLNVFPVSNAMHDIR